MKSCTIVLTRYSEENELVMSCLTALSKQENVYCKILFLDQRRDNKIKALCKQLSTKYVKFIYKNIPAISLSYARELGTKLSQTNIILFTDADAIPDKNWAYELTRIFGINEKIGIVGGKSIPKWLKEPSWYHKSNIIKEIYSLIDLSDKIIETKKIVGVNFGLNKKRLNFKEYFNPNLGRKPGSLLGGEETELCKRTLIKGFKIYYTPYAIVQHQIQRDRMSFFWIMRRFYYGGYGKAKTGGVPSTYSKKRNIYDKIILPIIAIPYFIGYFIGKVKK